jgi:hypothetical protein
MTLNGLILILGFTMCLELVLIICIMLLQIGGF